MRKFILTLLVPFILSSCIAERRYNAELNTFLNQPKEVLLMKWGMPNRTFKAKGNTELYVYKKYRKQTEYEKSMDIYGLYPEYRCDTTFTVQNGIVTNWSWEGNDCHVRRRNNSSSSSSW